MIPASIKRFTNNCTGVLKRDEGAERYLYIKGQDREEKQYAGAVGAVKQEGSSTRMRDLVIMNTFTCGRVVLIRRDLTLRTHRLRGGLVFLCRVLILRTDGFSITMCT